MERSRLTGLLCAAALTLPLLAHADALTRPGAEDSACRPAIPLPTADAPDRRIAITLAGGGTKASSFALGVLGAAVTTPLALSADPTRYSNALFWQSDAVSSVSGGSYAAFYLYSRLIRNRPLAGEATPASLDQSREVTRYFRDCIPAHLEGVLSGDDGRLIQAEARERGVAVETLFCPATVRAGDNDGSEDFAAAQARARRYWNETRPETRNLQFVRCHADILTWQRCEFKNTPGAGIRSTTSTAVFAIAPWIVLGPRAWCIARASAWPTASSPSTPGRLKAMRAGPRRWAR